jgi:hypothetical protein
MSNTTNLDARLARLDSSSLAQIVPQLPPETLHQLIQHRGLDACGDLVLAATPAQLTSLLDLDLWPRPQPGRDEQFDVERFGEWLDVLVDSGESEAARIVAALDRPLVILGLSRYLRVFDPGTFEPTAQSDDEAMDRNEMMSSETTTNVPQCEIGGYLLRARRFDAWDAIIALLTALETTHAECFHALMRGCRLLSNSTPEFGGFDGPMMAPEQHLFDVAVDREERRAQQGFATSADARAFIQMARQHAPHEPIAINPIAAAYFREVAEIPAQTWTMTRPPGNLLEPGDDSDQSARLPELRRLMEYVRDHDETAYLARSRELAFLANVLVAGCSVQSRTFTPQEASDAAACVCNLGLECWRGEALPDEFFVDHDLVMAFESGWSALYRDVSVFVADRLASTLADLQCADTDQRLALAVLRRTLARYRETPWLARGATDVLARLDPTAWISVVGLLDECPVIPATLNAVLEGRTTPISPTAFEFISTAGQIGDVRVFMAALATVLSR